MRYPTNIKCGPNASRMIPDLLQGSRKKRPLLVTDKALAEQQIIKDMQDFLKQKKIDYQLFSQTQGNPTVMQVEQGVEIFKQHHADSLILVGGGCALDVGKAIALLATHEGELKQYEDGLTSSLDIQDCIPFMIAIPTTAGTGSEVGGSAVISDNDTHRKRIIWSTHLVPNYAILDPLLSTSLPFKITAATGMDALTHNIEAFLAKSYHPLADGIALEGIRLIDKHLVNACHEPDNLDARSGMLLASAMGATAFQKGLGVTHSCAHALSTCFDLHHGLANAIMLLPCLRFNQKVVPERFVRLGQTLGFYGEEITVTKQFFDWLQRLIKTLDLSKSLLPKDITLTNELVQVAYDDPCHQNNPRACTKEDFHALFSSVIRN